MTKRGMELKIACLREGIYYYELARAVGVSPSLISKVGAGERQINDKRKKIIARILNRPMETIFD